MTGPDRFQDQSKTTQDQSDWQVRLAAAIAVHSRRRKLRAIARGEFAAARRHGLARRHTTKLRRIRGGQPTAARAAERHDMSNGFMGCGSANAEFSTPHDHGAVIEYQDHKGRITVSQNWTSSSNYVELNCRPDDDARGFTIYLDSANADAVEFAAAVLHAVDAEDMADELRSRNVKLAEREVIRERAGTDARAAKAAAEKAFLAATIEQRAAFDAAVDAEHYY